MAWPVRYLEKQFFIIKFSLPTSIAKMMNLDLFFKMISVIIHWSVHLLLIVTGNYISLNIESTRRFLEQVYLHWATLRLALLASIYLKSICIEQISGAHTCLWCFSFMFKIILQLFRHNAAFLFPIDCRLPFKSTKALTATSTWRASQTTSKLRHLN